MSQTRQTSETGLYHVVLKGNADQVIFESDSDRLRFLEMLYEAKQTHALGVLAWCLMDNHVHLIIDDPNMHLVACMNLLEQRFAIRFNGRCSRTGVVFRRPFWSEPILSDEHLLAALAYVHNNPQAAGICRASDYRWSSYSAYANNIDERGVTDTAMILEMLYGREGFVRFSESMPPRATPFMGSRLTKHLTDQEALRICDEALGEGAVSTIKQLSPVQRCKPLASLLDLGLTKIQIKRLTGLASTQIERALATLVTVEPSALG